MVQNVPFAKYKKETSYFWKIWKMVSKVDYVIIQYLDQNENFLLKNKLNWKNTYTAIIDKMI